MQESQLDVEKFCDEHCRYNLETWSFQDQLKEMLKGPAHHWEKRVSAPKKKDNPDVRKPRIPRESE